MPLTLVLTEGRHPTWLTAYPRRGARSVTADAAKPRTFPYPQDPGHGWLVLSRADLDFAGMSSADFSGCSSVSATD